MRWCATPAGQSSAIGHSATSVVQCSDCQPVQSVAPPSKPSPVQPFYCPHCRAHLRCTPSTPDGDLSWAQATGEARTGEHVSAIAGSRTRRCHGEGLLRAARGQRHRHGAGGRHLRLLRGLGLPQPQVPADVSILSP